MGELVNQLKVWSATRDMDRGKVDYDRLKSAGLPGQIVLNNIFERMISDAEFAANTTVNPGSRHNDSVSLGMGGTQTFAKGHFHVAEGAALSVRAPEGIVVSTNIHYELSNEPQEAWSALQDRDSTASLYGRISGSFEDMDRELLNAYRQALLDPSGFINAAVERFVEAEGAEGLAFLGQDAVAALVAGPSEQSIRA